MVNCGFGKERNLNKFLMTLLCLKSLCPHSDIGCDCRMISTLWSAITVRGCYSTSFCCHIVSRTLSTEGAKLWYDNCFSYSSNRELLAVAWMIWTASFIQRKVSHYILVDVCTYVELGTCAFWIIYMHIDLSDQHSSLSKVNMFFYKWPDSCRLFSMQALKKESLVSSI